MRNVLPLALLFALACSSSAPQYTKTLDRDASGMRTVHIESVSDMSADSMRAALYTEAAHATIDDGMVYLRVAELSADSSIAVRETAQATPDPVTKTRSANVALSRHRSGVIRFEPSRVRPPSGEVYAASELLDQLKNGSVPRH